MMKNKKLTRRLRKGDEAGMTLVELLVAMGVLTVLMAVSLAAIVSMSRSTVRIQAVSDSTDELRILFQRLDKEVRYASTINAPVQSGDDYYVEYLVEATAGDGASQCIQWRYVPAEKVIQRREWPLNTAETTQWVSVVSDVRNDLSIAEERPFTLIPIETVDGRVYSRQQLEIFVDSGLGEAGSSEGGQLDVSFTAQNSSKASPNTVCMNTGVGRS